MRTPSAPIVVALLAPLLVAANDAKASAACKALKQQFPTKYTDSTSANYAAEENVNWYVLHHPLLLWGARA